MIKERKNRSIFIALVKMKTCLLIFSCVVFFIFMQNKIIFAEEINSKEDSKLDTVLHLINKGKTDEAVAICNEVINKNPTNIKAYIYYARVLIEREEDELALNNLNRAILLDSKCSLAYMARGQLYWKLYQYDKAKKDIETALKLWQTNVNLHKMYNDFLLYYDFFKKKKDKYDINIYSQMIEKYPNAISNYINRAISYYINGKEDLAVKDLYKAGSIYALKIVQKDFDNVNVYRRLLKKSLEEIRTLNFESSKFCLDKAISLDIGNNVDFYLYYAGIYALLGNIDKAIEIFKKMEKLNVDNELIRNYLARLRSIQTKLEVQKKSSDKVQNLISKYAYIEQILNPDGKGNIYFICQSHYGHDTELIRKDQEAGIYNPYTDYNQLEIFNMLNDLTQETNLKLIIGEGYGEGEKDGRLFNKGIKDLINKIKETIPYAKNKDEIFLNLMNMAKIEGYRLLEYLAPEQIISYGAKDDKIVEKSYQDLKNDNFRLNRSVVEKRSELYLREAILLSKQLSQEDVAIVIGIGHKQDIINTYRGSKKLWIIIPKSLSMISSLIAPELNKQNLGIISYYLETKNWDNALIKLDELLEFFPDNDVGYALRAYVKYNLNRYNESLKDINNAIEFNPYSYEHFNFRSKIKRAIGDNLGSEQDKITSLQMQAGIKKDFLVMSLDEQGNIIVKEKKQEKKNVRDGRNTNEKLEDLIKSKNYKQAIIEIDGALAEGGDDYRQAALYDRKGNVYSCMNENGKALVEFSKAIELEPLKGEIYSNRGSIYQKMGMFEEAINDFDKAIQLLPQNSTAYYNRGNCFLYRREFEKAMEDYTHVIEIDPEYIGVYNNRGEIYYHLKQYDKAIEDTTREIKKNPQIAIAYFNRARSYFLQGEYALALIDCTKVLSIDPNDKRTKSMYKELLEKLGKS